MNRETRMSRTDIFCKMGNGSGPGMLSRRFVIGTTDVERCRAITEKGSSTHYKWGYRQSPLQVSIWRRSTAYKIGN